MKFTKLPTLVLGFLAGGLLTACTAEEGFDQNADGIKLVKPTEVYAYSNGVNLATRSADVNGNLWYQNWDRPTNVTEEEIAKVLEEASKQRVGAKNDIHIDWNNYWVQQVYTGEQTYIDGAGNDIGTGSSHMNHLLAYTDKVNEQTAWWPEPEFTLRDKYSYENVYEHINNFNNGDNNTEYTDDVTGQKYYGTTLMTDMYAEGIIDQFGYHNTTDSKNHFEYIILEIDGSYYICFDFWAEHPEGQDANKNMDVERDWIFNDWIVKISPAYHVGETPETPETPTPPTEDKCDKCDHPSHDGENCPQCDEDTECHPKTPDTPDVPVVDATDHVEVNLSIEDNEGSIKQTHLSIHVRAATDVEVFIPVPMEYYCDADDMAIVNKHETELMIHGGPLQTSWNVNGNVVTLTVTFEDGGIRVKTNGINEDVIAYCQQTYGDGITFEVWNYFNDALTSSELKGYLDQSTIEFLTKCPDMYVNAFNKDADGNKFEWDCDCSIVDSQRSQYGPAEQGKHYNESPYNDKYYNNNYDRGSGQQE